MKQTFCWIVCLALVTGCWQPAQAVAPAQAAPAAPKVAQPIPVLLGSSAMDLFGPWRFHTGDDPAWAQPGCDDSSWESVDLHAPDDPPNPPLGGSGFAPGWTSLGHPNYSGYAWYRIRLNLQDSPDRLALKMPDSFDDAYQVFVNGQPIGEFGHFGSRRAWAYLSQPRGFPFPRGVHSGPVVIAIRMWMNSASRFSGPDAGGLHGPPMIGTAATIADQVTLDWTAIDHQLGSIGILELLVLLLALVVAATHYALDRTDKAYLWLALVALATLLSNLVLQLGNYTTLLSATTVLLSHDALLVPLRIGLWVLFWAAWFRLKRRMVFHLVWDFVFILGVTTLLLRPPLHGQFIPLRYSAFLSPVSLWIKLGLAGILFGVTYKGLRRNRAEGWLALPAILLAIAANYQHELHLAHIRTDYSLLGYTVSLSQLSTMLSLVLVTLMASRRFLLAQRDQVQYELEVKQASELQQVIMPSKLPQVPGLRIEGEYRPSRDVGGDFFQIIPNHQDGSVLIVVGDVTGKGLRAGMLVALIVGAIDTAAKEDPDPARLMSRLNDRLCDRGYATATCLVMKICEDGLVTAANAGHLPPYINGKEMEMEGALPLGVLSDMTYDSVAYRLQEGDALTLMTDGVVEATDEDGALFGFERIEQMVAGHASATDIAEAAQRFGQEDDILVLRVQRTAEHGALIPA